MSKKMLIDAAHPEEVRVAVLSQNRIEDFDFESAGRKPLRGNIFLARVTRVEPSLQAAFVDFGGNRHGFLAFSEIHPDYYQIPVSDRKALQEAEREVAELAAQLELSQRGDDDDDDEEKLAEDEAAALDRGDAGQSASAADADDEDENAGGDAGDDIEASADDSDEDVVDEEESEEDGVVDDDARPRRREEEEEEEDRDEDDDDDDDDDVQDDEIDDADVHDEEQTDGSIEARGRNDNDEEEDEEEDDDDASDATSALSEEDDEDEDFDDDESDEEEDDEDDEDVDEDDEEDDEEDDDEEGSSAEARLSRDELFERYKEAKRKRAQLLRNYKIQEVIKRRQILLIQVVKEERGNKGAALTTYLSLAGRYCVLMPNTARGGGISRKISNSPDRRRLRRVVDSLDVPQGMGLIIRTAGAKRTKTEIKRDYDYLLRLWENIRSLTLKSVAPCLIYEEASLIKRAIRDLYDKDISKVYVEGEDGYREAKDFMKMLMPSHAKNVQPHKDAAPIFLKYGVESQLDGMYQPSVRLKSGGYIVIHQTEALVAIDVNSGRATRERNIEQTALKTNIEAAEEAARQFRLRDLAGLIVIDFIDMEEPRNNRKVEKALKEALKSDRARVQVGRISSFGLLEMSRQRRRSGIVDGTTQTCPTCAGAGVIRSHEIAALRILRAVEGEAIAGKVGLISVRASTEVALHVLNHNRDWLNRIEQANGVTIEITADPKKNGDEYDLDKSGAPRPVTNAAPVIRADQTEPVEIEDFEPADLGDDEDDEEEDRQDRSGSRSKRKRRRRPRRSKSERDDQRAEDADANSESGDEEKSANAEQAEGDAPPKKRRRRGRRGGRRNRRDADQQADATEGREDDGETADAASSEADSAGETAESASDAPQEQANEPETAPTAPQSDSDDGDAGAESEAAPETEDQTPPPGAAANGASKASEPEATEDETPVSQEPEPASQESKKPTRRGWWNRSLF